MIKPSQARNVLVSLCLSALVVGAYAPVRHFGFINFDDRDYVYQNPEVLSGLTLQGIRWAFKTNHAANWHPVTWLSHMLDCQLFGLNPGAQHMVNVLFHVASTLLLFHILNLMTTAPWRSAFVAALFALHPLHVESVAWVAERKDVLSAFFWMLTLWTYVKYAEALKACPPSADSRVRVFYGLALLSFTLGLMSKPILVTLPFVLLLLDYWPLGRTPWAKPVVGERLERSLTQLLVEKLPFLALSAVSCVVTVWAQRSGRAVASMEALAFNDRLANATVSYVWYIGKMIWPTALAVLYPYHEWSLRVVLWAGVALLGISVVIAWRARREPYLAVGWLWYVGTLVPAIGLVQVGVQSAADRYTYLPSIGLFMMLAWSVPRALVGQRFLRWATAMVGTGLVAACAVLCKAQVGYWRNSETLFRHDLEVTRPNWTAYNNLALAFAAEGKLQEATKYFEQALRLKPEYAESHYNFGLALAGQGRLPEAIEQWKQAVQINPDYAEAEFNLGVAFQQTGKPQEAVQHFQQVVRIKPDSAEAYYNLGNALVLAGRPEDSIRCYQEALRLKPDYADARYNLAVILAQADKTNPAR